MAYWAVDLKVRILASKERSVYDQLNPIRIGVLGISFFFKKSDQYDLKKKETECKIK